MTVQEIAAKVVVAVAANGSIIRHIAAVLRMVTVEQRTVLAAMHAETQ